MAEDRRLAEGSSTAEGSSSAEGSSTAAGARKVLLLSAYGAGSHVNWQRALEHMFTHWTWRSLVLPPRHFSWRVRGNPLYWSVAEREVLAASYDLLVVTSLVDLATLRGLVPQLTRLPTLLYFHENQFDYPQNRQKHSLLEAQMVSIYGALCADKVVFNSAYNRDSFLDGVRNLLTRLPDYAPPEVVALIEAKSQVLGVPFGLPGDSEGGNLVDNPGRSVWQSRGASAEPLRLVWVGRFEHDKGGEELLAVLRELEQRCLCYELALVGQRFRQLPPAFATIEAEFAGRLVQFGYLKARADYYRLLEEADVVLSTARHEFQGLAVLEAVASGCLPVLPRRQAYPEIYPQDRLYDSCPDDPRREAQSAADRVLACAAELKDGAPDVPDVSAFTAARLAPRYASLFASLAAGSREVTG